MTEPTPTEPTATPEPESQAALPPGAPKYCQNCGAKLQGPHCYACGQPIKGVVRHFGSLVGDFFDTVFEYDNRLWRTMVPLLFKPGHISDDYLAGRRVRYVSPFRLFFLMSVLAFFVAQFAFDIDDAQSSNVGPNIEVNAGGGMRGLREAMTVADVEQRRDALLAERDRALAELGDSPGAAGERVGIEAGRKAVVSAANKRIASLQAAESAGLPAPAPEAEKSELRFGTDEPWNAETNPLTFDRLGDAGNAWVNQQIGRAEKNMARIQEDPDLLKEAVLGALPITFFVLMPIFALLLKVAYLFKHRLYMEHMIVALHSHAFMSLALLLLALFSLLKSWSGLSALGVVEAIVMLWIPIYLLLTQKRVYRQGWIMTLLKFAALGFVYFALLLVGVVLTVLWAWVWL